MMRCREVAEGIAGDRFANAGLLTRIELRIHLAMCKLCKRYARQMRALGEDTRCRSDDLPELSDESREKIVDACLDAARRARDSDAKDG